MTRRLSLVALLVGSVISTGIGSASLQPAVAQTGSFSPTQQADLQQIATATWNFMVADLDPSTNLPRNGLPTTGSTAAHSYASPTNIGLYLTSIVAARDLGIISADEALQRATVELAEISTLRTYQGFPLRYYSTANGQPINGNVVVPDGQGMVSTVDDAWYEQGLVVARNAFPALATGFSSLINAMNWSFLYDAPNNLLTTSFDVGTKTQSGTDYNVFYAGPRIAVDMAIGSGTVPGKLWWGPRRTPAASIASQPPIGSSVAYTDPQSNTPVRVLEGHYVYQGINFVPSFGGNMFEALAPALVVPEVAFGPANLGKNDAAFTAAQEAYATNTLHFSGVWGLAPATVPGSVTKYAIYGANGLAASKSTNPQNAVQPYAAALGMMFDPQGGYSALTQMRAVPGAFTNRGFVDSISPTTGAVAGRSLQVSQAAMLDAIDNALSGNSLTSYLAVDPFGQAIQPYLALERFSI